MRTLSLRAHPSPALRVLPTNFGPESQQIDASTAHAPSPLFDSPNPTSPLALSQELETSWIAYQPLVSWSEGRVIGYEALLRTDHSRDRCPAYLFSSAWELGATRELGRAIRQRIAASIPALPEGAAIYVNVGLEDLRDDGLLSGTDALAPFAARIVLELTEHDDNFQHEAVAERIALLRQAGYRVAIDDLGAGHNGLITLAELQVDAVKIDMSLVRGLGTNPIKRRVVEFIHRLCHEGGMQCVSEGVETRQDVEALLALGADVFQGYLFGRPQRLDGGAR